MSIAHVVQRINKKYIKTINALQNLPFAVAVEMSKSLIHEVMNLLVQKFDLIPIVGFSGGKESTALLTLMVKTLRETEILDRLRIIYIEIPGNTHEENIRYVYSIIRRLKINGTNFVHLRSNLDFYETLKKWGFPSFKRRWCMNIFKRKVLLDYVNSLGKDVIVFIGDRFSDSKRRFNLLSKKGTLEYNETWKQYTVHPIAHWTLSHVLSYLVLNNIELNPLYFKIGSSGNCVYCPFITDIDYYKRLRKFYPKWYKKILNVELSMVKKGGALYVANRVYRLYDILEQGNITEQDLKFLKYKRPCYYCVY